MKPLLSRPATALTTALTKALTTLACVLALAGCKTGLYSGLNEGEANEIVAALTAEGIAATKERLEGVDWQVQVDEGRMNAALAVLREQGLPNSRYTSIGDMFQKQGLVSTPSEERMRYIYAVSQELSQTLRSVDGVVSARVHVVIPANDPLSDKLRPSSAAVFIKHRPDVDLRLLTPAVKDLVAHSIEGLNYDQVSLTLVESRRAPASAAALAAPTEAGEPRLVLGVLPMQTAVILLVAMIAAAAALMVLPTLLRRQGLEWRAWVRQVIRR